MLILIHTALEAIKNGKSLPKMFCFNFYSMYSFKTPIKFFFQILIVVIASSSSTVRRSTILVLLILLLLAGVSTKIATRRPRGWTPILWGLMVTRNSVLLTWRGLRGLLGLI